ncbi:MAG: BCCT family transporter, partial [Pseudomonadales bacterium]|nr:BCCT family transporter [Pseudomonadales bacterium]
TPLFQRVFWCVFLGLLGVALLLGGGLASLQALALATGFPFGLVMLLMIVGLYRGLSMEKKLLDDSATDYPGTSENALQPEQD